MSEENKLKVDKIEGSELLFKFICKLRFDPEVIEQMGETDAWRYGQWLSGILRNPQTVIYLCMVDGEAAGAAFAYPVSERGYEAHQMFAPEKELRRHAIELVKMCFARFWGDVPANVTHLFAQVPKNNRRALVTDRLLGFQRLCTIPDYCDNGDVELIFIRRPDHGN